MTRLEFTDGKSSKFWEIAVEGKRTITTFGRIGTNGQTRAKEFASPEKAQADAAKKTAEKIKKGYADSGATMPAAEQDTCADASPSEDEAVAQKAPAEVEPEVDPELAADANAKPAGAERPAPSPTNPDSLPAIFAAVDPEPEEPIPSTGVSGYLYGAPLPRRDRPIRTELYSNLETVVSREDKARTERAKEFGPRMRAMAEMSVVDRSIIDLVLRDPLDDSAGSVQERATAAAVLSHIVIPGRHHPDVGRWFAHDPAFAVLAHELFFDFEVVDPPQKYRYQQPYGPKTRVVGRTEPGYGCAAELRRLLAQASDDDYERARTAAGGLRDRHYGTRARAAFLFPTETAWVEEIAEEFSAAPTPEVSQLIGATVSTHKQLDLYMAESPRVPIHQIADLMDAFGADLAPWLKRWLDGSLSTTRKAAKKPNKDQSKRLLDALVVIETDEAFGYLADVCDRPKVLPLFTHAAERRPHRAIRVLAAKVATSKRQSLVDTLKAIVYDHPGAVVAVWDDLDEPSRQAIVDLVGEPDSPTAPVGLLPAALAEPAWLKPRPKPTPAPVIKDVVSLRSTPVSPEAVAAHTGPTPEQLEPWTEQYEAWINPIRGRNSKEEPERDALVAGADLAVLHDACRQLNDTKLQIYGTTTLRYAQTLHQRFGDDSLPSLMFLFTLMPILVPFVDGLSAPEVAPFVASSFTDGRKAERRIPADWLLRHHENAVHGLVPNAVGEHGEARRAAEAALKHIATEHRSRIDAISAEYGDQVVAVIAATLDFEAVPKKAPTMPPFLNLARTPLPRLASGDHRLSPGATEHLLAMFALSEPGNPYSELPGVLDALDRASCNAMLWSIFNSWKSKNFPSKSSWILKAFAHVGDDDTVRQLVPYIRTWPGESAHKRATVGLDVLREIGSDLAMMHLYGMSQKMRFKSLKSHAGEMVQKIADDRGLTELELGDRLVPDLGLAADGSMVLDYGARSFSVEFDEALKPVVRDESGKIRKTLPKAAKADDAELAAVAKKQFSALKKDARTIAAGQITRLEHAMVGERRWSKSDFDQYFVNHPLMVHLVSRVVWGVFENGALTQTFRLSEDRSFANAADEETQLPHDAIIGIPHPVHFQPGEIAVWGEVLSDYEILQSFEQIGRPMLQMTDAELASAELTRFNGPIHSFDRYLSLERYGWARGSVEDAGIRWGLYYPLADGDYIELTVTEGLFTGSIAESPDQAIGRIELKGKKTFAELDELTRSELLRSLAAAFDY